MREWLGGCPAAGQGRLMTLRLDRIIPSELSKLSGGNDSRSVIFRDN